MYKLLKGKMNDNETTTSPPNVGESTVNTSPRTSVTHDEDALNLNRSASSDTESVPTVLVKPKKTIKISTFNVRTAKDDWRVHELIHHMDKQGISIIGIQEHRRIHSEEVKFQQIDNHMLITISAWRNKAQAATGGVGILLSNAAEKVLSDVTRISDRIIKATFAGNPETSIIVAYSPTNVREHQDEANSFYNELRQAIDATPPHNLLMILGDMNAKISSAHTKHALNKKINENGKRLIELTCEKSLLITNTMFQKRNGKQWSFEDPKGNRSLLDYILVNNKWKNSITNTEAYSSFSSVGSDHRIVTAEVKLSLRVSKPPSKKIRYDWKLLRHDQELQDSFRLELRNKFSELYKEEDTSTVQYEALIKANEYAASKTLPQVKKGKKEKYANNPAIQQARKKVDQLTKKYATNKSNVVRKCLQDAKAALQVEYQRLEEAHLQCEIGKISTNFQNKDTGEAWKIVNTITNRKSAPAGKLKGKTPEERKQQWFNHFKKLLGSPVEQTETPNILTILRPDQVNIDDSKFILDEVVKARKQVKEGTAPGEDGIMPEVLQRINIDDIILTFANKLLEDSDQPDQFSILNLVPLPKSGDLSVTDNYRGIALSSLVAKIVNKMLLNRIRPKIDPLLRGNQSGFRPGRSTIAQILALRRIIEEVKKNNLSAVMVFIDFCKAFDSICHQAMFAILEAYGIPAKIVNAIKEVYRKATSKRR